MSIPTDSSWSYPLFVDFQPLYQNDLRLQFTNDLSVPGGINPIVIGPSYECVNSWNCGTLQDGPTRYLVSGSASARIVPDGSVPEPAAWALMIVGFGMTRGL